jgi:hypothetical protein
MATATYHGTNYALKAAPLIGTWPNAASCNAPLYCMSEEVYATASVGDSGSILYVGILPVGAIVQFSMVWPIDSTDMSVGGDAMTNAVTGELGTLTDPDLFGDITTLGTTATPQVIEPCPDGTIYTTTLDFALVEETTVIFKTGGAALVNTEGIAIKIFYTMAGKTGGP